MNVPFEHLLYKEIDGEPRLAISYSQIETFLQCPYKWYRIYVMGERSMEKQEATSYGSVVHKTLEYFFKNGRQPTGKDLGEAISYYAHHEQIPWTSPEAMLTAFRQSGELLAWLVDLFKRDVNGFVRPADDLNPVEKIIRHAHISGVEEEFRLPYRLPENVTINGKTFEKVYLTGSIDLHLKSGENHYVIDWKSGKKLFDKKKLDENLQHPIYSFYIYRHYGKSLPKKNIYFFTRTREYQTVTVDMERIKKSVNMMNDVFKKMYNFKDRKVTEFYQYREKKDGTGYTRFKARLLEPLCENQKPCPSALCYFCDFGKHNRNVCDYSSDWDISKKQKN